MVKVGLEMSKALQDELVEEIHKSSEAGSNEINESKGDGPEETPREATQDDVTANDTKGNNPDELLKESVITNSAAERIYGIFSSNF